MRRINARVIALGLLAAGLLLSTAALVSAYGEGQAHRTNCAAHHSQIDDAGHPRS